MGQLELGEIVLDVVIKDIISAMNPVVVGPTKDRSVLGSLVDFAKAVPFSAPITDEMAFIFVGVHCPVSASPRPPRVESQRESGARET
jgi:hypothetical protein